MLNRLKELRKEKGDTLESLSKNLKEKFDLSLSTGQLSNYENEKRTPRDTKIWDCIADYFDVPVRYLLGYSYNKLETKSVEKLESIFVELLENIKSISDIDLEELKAFSNSLYVMAIAEKTRRLLRGEE